eukprot:m.16725 g.16725  ORF g.16725 m.16725 type:complete len:524 (+) comp7214_c0_seq1:43-1614(+)
MRGVEHLKQLISVPVVDCADGRGMQLADVCLCDGATHWVTWGPNDTLHLVIDSGKKLRQGAVALAQDTGFVRSVSFNKDATLVGVLGSSFVSVVDCGAREAHAVDEARCEVCEVVAMEWHASRGLLYVLYDSTLCAYNVDQGWSSAAEEWTSDQYFEWRGMCLTDKNAFLFTDNNIYMCNLDSDVAAPVKLAMDLSEAPAKLSAVASFTMSIGDMSQAFLLVAGQTNAHTSSYTVSLFLLEQDRDTPPRLSLIEAIRDLSAVKGIAVVDSDIPAACIRLQSSVVFVSFPGIMGLFTVTLDDPSGTDPCMKAQEVWAEKDSIIASLAIAAPSSSSCKALVAFSTSGDTEIQLELLSLPLGNASPLQSMLNKLEALMLTPADDSALPTKMTESLVLLQQTQSAIEQQRKRQSEQAKKLWKRAERFERATLEFEQALLAEMDAMRQQTAQLEAGAAQALWPVVSQNMSPAAQTIVDKLQMGVQTAPMMADEDMASTLKTQDETARTIAELERKVEKATISWSSFDD